MDLLSDAVAAARTGVPVSYLVRCQPAWGRRYQATPGAGFHVVLDGAAWLIDPPAAPVALSVGDVVLFPHGHEHGMADHPDTPLHPMPHTAEDDAPAGRRTVEVGPDRDHTGGIATVMLCGMYRFARERPHPLLRDLPHVMHLPARPGRHHALRATIDLLAAEIDTVRPGGDAAVTALLDLLLVHVLRVWFDDNSNVGWGAALADPVAGTALRAMHADPGHPWTVEELGTVSGMSRAAFARRFKRLVGQGPLGYLAWWRMTTAAALLTNSDAPLSAIGKQVGYTSEFAFANAFRREYGTAPGRYRTRKSTRPSTPTD